MKTTRGFSLIEVLVVVAIISLLASILMPAFGEVRRVSRKTFCQHNLHQIGVGMQAYLQANRDFFPFAARFPSREAGIAAAADRDPYPPLPLALARQLGGSVPSDLTTYMDELAAEGKRGTNSAFLCPADLVTPAKADPIPPGIVRVGDRHYDTQTTSYEWQNQLDGVKLNVRSILILDVLPPVRYTYVQMLTDFDNFHGGPNRKGSLNMLYADLRVDSE